MKISSKTILNDYLEQEGFRVVEILDPEESQNKFLDIYDELNNTLPMYKNIESFYGNTAWDMAEAEYNELFGLMESFVKDEDKWWAEFWEGKNFK